MLSPVLIMFHASSLAILALILSDSFRWLCCYDAESEKYRRQKMFPGSMREDDDYIYDLELKHARRRTAIVTISAWTLSYLVVASLVHGCVRAYHVEHHHLLTQRSFALNRPPPVGCIDIQHRWDSLDVWQKLKFIRSSQATLQQECEEWHTATMVNVWPDVNIFVIDYLTRTILAPIRPVAETAGSAVVAFMQPFSFLARLLIIGLGPYILVLGALLVMLNFSFFKPAQRACNAVADAVESNMRKVHASVLNRPKTMIQEEDTGLLLSDTDDDDGGKLTRRPLRSCA